MEIIQKPLSNRNYQDRRTWGLEFICMHTEGIENPVTPRSDPSLYAQFNNPNNKVSAHFYVKRNGKIEQYVDIKYAAWAVGSPELNIKSISIEHQDDGRWNDSRWYTDAQYESSAQLVAWLWGQVGRLPLYPHNKFARRACPGALDIGRIERRALEIFNIPKPQGSPIYVSVQKGDGFVNITKRAGWPNYDYTKLANLNPSHPAIKRGSLWADDPPFIVGYTTATAPEPDKYSYEILGGSEQLTFDNLDSAKLAYETQKNALAEGSTITLAESNLTQGIMKILGVYTKPITIPPVEPIPGLPIKEPAPNIVQAIINFINNLWRK